MSSAIETAWSAGRSRAVVTATVAICCYTEDRYGQLLSAVASLRAQTRAPEQIVVVVDHNDVLRARVRAEIGDMAGALVVANRHEQGLSGGRNTAIDVATGDVVVFLDDDAAAEPTWLEVLLRHFDAPEVVAAGTAVTPRWERGRPRWFPVEFDWVVGCTYRGMPTTAGPVRNPIGASMALRRDAVRDSGGFRVDLGRIGTHPVGGEETEICIRMVRDNAAARIVMEPAVTVHHWVPAERARFGYFRRRCVAEGLSKARIARSMGRRASLSSERTYVRRVLPGAVRRELRAVLHGDPDGLLRAGAVVAGLVATTVGYVRGLALAHVRHGRSRVVT